MVFIAKLTFLLNNEWLQTDYLSSWLFGFIDEDHYLEHKKSFYDEITSIICFSIPSECTMVNEFPEREELFETDELPFDMLPYVNCLYESD